MCALLLRTSLVAVAVLTGSSAIAADLGYYKYLQCAPKDPLKLTSIAKPYCPILPNDEVRIDECSCPDGFNLVRASVPPLVVSDFSPT